MSSRRRLASMVYLNNDTHYSIGANEWVRVLQPGITVIHLIFKKVVYHGRVEGRPYATLVFIREGEDYEQIAEYHKLMSFIRSLKIHQFSNVVDTMLSVFVHGRDINTNITAFMATFK